tara:strand:+ start:646 stop:1317 length:672 start_codon:yes stop_codon:yes gene_type:complete
MYMSLTMSAAIFPLLFAQNTCPIVEPMTGFNTTEYIRGTWFIQQQQITGYQPAETLFCVAQTLDSTNKTVPFFSGNVVLVYNYGNVGAVNGPSENRNNFTLCARQPNENLPSQIINAPCFLPNTFAGPYWVIAAGPSSFNYSWAIVSGGPPTVKYKDGNCSTKQTGTNGSGLWLFTRARYGPQADYYTSEMRDILIQKGYTTSQLLNVSQRGCNYTGAFIKSV